MKCNFYAVPAFHCKSALLNERHFWISVFNCLQEPSKHVGALNKRELLAGTDPWAPREWNVVPAKLHTLPPFRPEVVGIFTPYILVSLHGAKIHTHLGSARYKDWCLSLGPTASGDYAVLQTDSHVTVSRHRKTKA